MYSEKLATIRANHPKGMMNVTSVLRFGTQVGQLLTRAGDFFEEQLLVPACRVFMSTDQLLEACGYTR